MASKEREVDAVRKERSFSARVLARCEFPFYMKNLLHIYLILTIILLLNLSLFSVFSVKSDKKKNLKNLSLNVMTCKQLMLPK